MTCISIAENHASLDSYSCRCDNCGREVDSSDLRPIRDAEERLEPGGETPAGECPACGALAYLTS